MQSKLSYKQDDIKLINDFTEGMFNKNIKKAKVYIKTPQQAPQGAKIGRGKHGGLYYESEERQHFREEVLDIEQNIKSNMKFSDAEEMEVKNVINRYATIAKNEFRRVLGATNEKVSYRIKGQYSILEKMKRKNLKIGGLQDILGMRIEVNDIKDIYNTVKKLERVYGNRIITKEDYINSPKDKYYRAYHMNVEYAPGVYSEIQIRTPLMDKVANAGHVLFYKRTKEIDDITKTNIQQTLDVYSNIAVNNAKISDLKMLPHVKEMFEKFGL